MASMAQSQKFEGSQEIKLNKMLRLVANWSKLPSFLHCTVAFQVWCNTTNVASEGYQKVVLRS
ncbi:hypothetical protein FRX31_003892 [Thalictrum thalictroides]|uniref:Uncharacterized protein n=1 Tax=Thalictrum thalictroides TaxID=46969 RepID=A0A7J6X9Q6_THATH|nr:hypothetical protein FRX31_003892 [Thalictrum thalictroides]